jgi:hypothetical protein
MQALFYCIFIYNKLAFITQLICYCIEVLLVVSVIGTSHT